MDYENERVIKLIFPNGVPTNLQENPDFTDYLYKLGTYKIDQLKKEQAKLIEENKQIVEHTQDLAISNYKVFIQSSECSRAIFKEFVETEKKLDGLINKLPDFKQKCEDFITTSGNINVARRLNSLTLKRNAQLLEILELPQLMDTCIRSGKYEEALELAAYVQRLGTKNGNIPIINSIVLAIESSWHTMLKQLLAQLHTDLQLPKCLQVVGYLRRMQAFTTPELKLKFLQARDTWLKECLSQIPADDPQHHLTKTIEVTRINLFNIITQYKAIFSDNTDDALKDPNDCGNKLFHSWLHEKIEEFLVTLENDLSHKDLTSLDTILGQCMYFGLSFSRVGADFRGLMSPIFIRVILQNFNEAVVKLTRQFEIDIDNFTLINKINTGLKRMKVSPEKQESNYPPETLLDFHPLAVYCNGILTAFNDLRLCSPIALADQVTKVLQSSLENVCKNILTFYRQEQQAFTSNERENFIKMCSCFAYDLLPYIQRCIHLIFPPTSIAVHCGINVLTLQKVGLSYLKQKQILEPLDYLLPDKVDAVIQQVAERKLSESQNNPSEVPLQEEEAPTPEENVLSTEVEAISDETKLTVVQEQEEKKLEEVEDKPETETQ